jgi:hypothetical protein
VVDTQSVRPRTSTFKDYEITNISGIEVNPQSMVAIGVASLGGALPFLAHDTSMKTSDSRGQDKRGRISGGVTNPVLAVEREAINIWAPISGDLQPILKCFLSIGAGQVSYSGTADVSDNPTLRSVMTLADQVDGEYTERWRRMHNSNRHYRFNVNKGLENLSPDNWVRQEAATSTYLKQHDEQVKMANTVAHLQSKSGKRFEHSDIVTIRKADMCRENPIRLRRSCSCKSSIGHVPVH